MTEYGSDEERAALRAHFDTARARAWADGLVSASRRVLRRHGHAGDWETVLAGLPDLRPASVSLTDRIRIGEMADAGTADRAALENALRALAPWRKGPFTLFGIEIDAEWRSDAKWSRVVAHAAPLAGRRVLDIGCGNGYYAFRMAGAGARLVLGLDPSVLCIMQFRAVRHYLAELAVHVLPATDEHVDSGLRCFDTVFSMGVLYHRRDPAAHLDRLIEALRAGGELVLETLVLANGEEALLEPDGRYARMRNVRAVPSTGTALRWLRAAGFKNARCVDVTATTVAEQRSTDWMTSQSLADFLDPVDPGRTIEGYPAPVRGVFIATAP